MQFTPSFLYAVASLIATLRGRKCRGAMIWTLLTYFITRSKAWYEFMLWVWFCLLNRALGPPHGKRPMHRLMHTLLLKGFPPCSLSWLFSCTIVHCLQTSIKITYFETHGKLFDSWVQRVCGLRLHVELQRVLITPFDPRCTFPDGLGDGTDAMYARARRKSELDVSRRQEHRHGLLLIALHRFFPCRSWHDVHQRAGKWYSEFFIQITFRRFVHSLILPLYVGVHGNQRSSFSSCGQRYRRTFSAYGMSNRRLTML